MSRRFIVLALALAAGVVAGCGSEDETTTTGSTNGPAVQTLKTPKADETIDEGAKRITEALGSADCDEVNEVNPSSRPALDNEVRCAYLRRFGRLPVADAESYDDGAGVIDLERGEGTLTAMVVADSDGRYKISYVDPFLGKPSVGTEFDPKFDRAAAATVRAFIENDCAAFSRLAFARFGPGRFEEKQQCEYVKNQPLGRLRAAQPKLIGGNESYAFYSVGTPAVAYTMIMARQTEEGVPENFPKDLRKLPEGASEYAFVDAIVTDRREPPDEDGGKSEKDGGGKSEKDGGEKPDEDSG